MENQTWLESSLRRSSELGREVFIRARRRQADWWSTRDFNSTEDQTSEFQENSDVHSNLDRAFTKIVENMSETTKQCKMFYSSTSAADLSQQEQNHVCRFHSQQSPQILGKNRHAASARRGDDAVSSVQRDLGCSEPEEWDVPQRTHPHKRWEHFKEGKNTRLRFDV